MIVYFLLFLFQMAIATVWVVRLVTDGLAIVPFIWIAWCLYFAFRAMRSFLALQKDRKAA